MRLKYVGPHRPGVDVPIPDGVTVQVAYGQERTFPDQVARSLLEQGEEHWQLVSHFGHQPEAVEYDGAVRPGEVARLMIRRLREERGWTQAQLVERLAQAGYPLGQTNLSRIESGRRRLAVDDLVAICAVLNISPMRLLDGSRLHPQPPVKVVPAVTVPLSRYRSWIRGGTPLPAFSDWRKASAQPWTNAFRSVLAPEDELQIQRRHIQYLTRAGQGIVDAALEAIDQIPDTVRNHLAEAVDDYDRCLRPLIEAAEPGKQPRPERRGRPRTPRKSVKSR